MRFFFCSQVSYFEIYLDKIRDLLDGKKLHAEHHLSDQVCVTLLSQQLHHLYA